MRCGLHLQEGFLPVFTVGTQEEAETLILLTCPRGMDGEFYARELADEQTLENLEAFSEKLDKAHDALVANGNCRCGGTKAVPRKHPAKKRK